MLQISAPSIPSQDFGVVLIALALYLTLRLYRNMKGTKYSAARVYLAPMIYLVLVIVSIVELPPSYIGIAVVAVAIVIGYAIGRRLAGGAKFFEKNGTTYYKRSPTIMVIWLVSFIIRFSVEYVVLPDAALIAIAVEVLLAFTTGMIIGEAHHINKAYAAYSGKAQHANSK